MVDPKPAAEPPAPLRHPISEKRARGNPWIPFGYWANFCHCLRVISLPRCLDWLEGSRDNCSVIERKHRKLGRVWWMIVTAVAFWFWLGTLKPVPPPAPRLDQPQTGQTR